jgi:SOS response regulatory protein OraA/RecX
MSLSFCLKNENRNVLVLCWEGEVWREVDKTLFISELSKFPSQLRWEEFLERFAQLEEKIAKKQALLLLAKRSYLSSDLESKLLAKGISLKASQMAIAFCQSKGFLNDDQEMVRLVQKEQRKGLGTRAIFCKLKHNKQIEDHRLRQALDQTELSEKEVLEKWLLKNAKKIKLEDPLEKRKLIAKLIRRGFSPDLVFNSLKK